MYMAHIWLFLFKRIEPKLKGENKVNARKEDIPGCSICIQNHSGGTLEASGDIRDGILTSEKWNMSGRKCCRNHVEVMF